MLARIVYTTTGVALATVLFCWAIVYLALAYRLSQAIFIYLLAVFAVIVLLAFAMLAAFIRDRARLRRSNPAVKK